MIIEVKNWLIRKWIIYKKWFFASFVIGIVVFGAGSQMIDKSIPQKSNLKASTDKILKSREIDDIRCDHNGFNCIKHGKIMSYDYVSEVMDNRDFIFSKEIPNYSNEIRVSDDTVQIFGRHLVYKGSDNKIYKIVPGATTTIEDFEKQTGNDLVSKLFNLFFKGKTALAATNDYYSGAAGDGYIENDGDGTWSSIRTALTGTAVDAAGTSARAQEYTDGFTRWIIRRNFFVFEASPIPDNAILATSTLNVKCAGANDNDNDANGYTTVVLGTQAATTTLSETDYDQIGSVALSDNFDTTNAVNGEWMKYTLNATGISQISLSTTTKLSIREGHDLNNDAISNTGTWTGIYISTSDSAGNEPYLEITYTVPAANTCTYSGSGNWTVQYSDNCQLQATYVKGAFNLIASTPGSLKIYGTIEADSFPINNTQRLNINVKQGINPFKEY